MDDMKLFSGRAHPELARRVCDYLGLPLGRAVMGNFPDGEISCKIDEDVRGRDVFIVQPTCPPVNENLMELLIMIESFKRASADRITAVMPYFGYARQDRKDEGRVPITAKLVANIITRAGADRVLAMDLHAAQIQGFFDIPVDHLYAAPVIDDHFRAMSSTRTRCGGQPGRGEHQAGPGPHGPAWRAAGHHRQAPQQRREEPAGARHRRRGRGQDGPDLRRHDQHRRLDLRRRPRHTPGGGQTDLPGGQPRPAGRRAMEQIQQAPIEALVITDSIPLPPEKAIPKIKVLSIAPLLGEAIKRIHWNESVSVLFE